MGPVYGGARVCSFVVRYTNRFADVPVVHTSCCRYLLLRADLLAKIAPATSYTRAKNVCTPSSLLTRMVVALAEPEYGVGPAVLRLAHVALFPGALGRQCADCHGVHPQRRGVVLHVEERGALTMRRNNRT